MQWRPPCRGSRAATPAGRAGPQQAGEGRPVGRRHREPVAVGDLHPADRVRAPVGRPRQPLGGGVVALALVGRRAGGEQVDRVVGEALALPPRPVPGAERPGGGERDHVVDLHLVRVGLAEGDRTAGVRVGERARDHRAPAAQPDVGQVPAEDVVAGAAAVAVEIDRPGRAEVTRPLVAAGPRGRDPQPGELGLGRGHRGRRRDRRRSGRVRRRHAQGWQVGAAGRHHDGGRRGEPCQRDPHDLGPRATGSRKRPRPRRA